jgi:hypothetical protein
MGGTETVTWDAFLGGSTDPAGGCENGTGSPLSANQQISAVSLFAPGSNTSAVPYDFCLLGLAQAP